MCRMAYSATYEHISNSHSMANIRRVCQYAKKVCFWFFSRDPTFPNYAEYVRLNLMCFLK